MLNKTLICAQLNNKIHAVSLTNRNLTKAISYFAAVMITMNAVSDPITHDSSAFEIEHLMGDNFVTFN